MAPAQTHRCPICRQPVAAAEAEFPFCSTRCRTIDLGKWATEAYVIHAPIHDPEALGEAERSRPVDPDEIIH